MFGKKITKDMSVVQIISASPLARGILLKHGIKFIGKGLSPLESLDTVAKGNGLSGKQVENILDEINSIKEERKDVMLKTTDAAADKLRTIIKSRHKKGIRLRLVSDGCSTYVYDMDFATKRTEGEVEVNSSGVKFFIEQKSMDFIKGTTIDYNAKEDGFVFQNPNVKS